MNRSIYLILTSTQGERCHHFFGSGNPLFRKHGDLGTAFRLKDRVKRSRELFGEDEFHQ